jgi:Fur family ferric uptake transcriptional regulator
MKRKCDSEELFKRGGIQSTLLRRSVLKALVQSNRALTPKGILSKVRKRRAIDKVTLYRILELFISRGILRRIATSEGCLFYEVVCQEHCPNHPHFVCRGCGEVKCLIDVDVQDLNDKIRYYRDREGEDIDLKWEGVCGQCQGP